MKQKFIIATVFLLFFIIPFKVYCQYTWGVYTSMVDSANQELWEEYGGGNGAANIIKNISTDINSNVYIAGTDFMSINFNDITLPSGIFVVKYDSIGNLKWAKSLYGGTNNVNSIVTDSNENCYVLGWFKNYICSGTIELESESSDDIFIIKFNKDGEVIWIKSVLSLDYLARPSDISIDEASNRIYITGYEDSTSTTSNSSELFIAKYNLLNCNLIKKITIAKQIGGGQAHNNAGYGITNDGSFIYITGSLRDSARYTNIYVSKLDTSLNIIWEKQFGDTTGENIGYDITLDDENNIYITGIFGGAVTFNNQTLDPQDWADLFIAKFNNDGNVLWVKSAGSNIPGYKGMDFGYSICFDNNNSIYLSGYVGHNAEFSSSIKTLCEGPFIAKYNKSGEVVYAKSFYTGYDSNYERGTGYVASDKNSNLFFSTNFIISITDTCVVNTNMNSMNIYSKIYPNPNFGILNIEHYSNTDEEHDIKIYDNLGNVVYHEKRNFVYGTNKITINLDFLPTGFYILIIENDNYLISTKKLQIIK